MDCESIAAALMYVAGYSLSLLKCSVDHRSGNYILTTNLSIVTRCSSFQKREKEVSGLCYSIPEPTPHP